MVYPWPMSLRNLPAKDQTLVQIVDTALADAAQRSGTWLVCKPGCTQCCVGVFSISQLDAARLQHGLRALTYSDPERVARIRARASESIERLSLQFPGNPATGLLDEDEASEARFADFGNDEPCPALDPSSGTCDLYASRPIPCRAFGPPVRSEDGLGVCELCFQGATDKEIATCEMEVDPNDLESELLKEMESAEGTTGRTIVAFVLAE